MTAAVNAGTSPLRAGLTELGMITYSGVMVSEAADVTADITDSELAGMVAGTVVGIGSYGGLKTLDQNVNISGLHPPGAPQTRSMKELANSSKELSDANEAPPVSYADQMPPEQAERYLRFLANGSMEGLTDVEIAAIRKVDEALALKRVDGQSILEIRNPVESGPVFEGGKPTVIYGAADIAKYQYNMEKILDH